MEALEEDSMLCRKTTPPPPTQQFRVSERGEKRSQRLRSEVEWSIVVETSAAADPPPRFVRLLHRFRPFLRSSVLC